MLYPCIFCVFLLMDLFVLCCMSDSVCALFDEIIRNMFSVIVWSSKECCVVPMFPVYI